MIDNTSDKPSVEFAQIQADLNAKREEARKSMSPTEVIRLDAIERAAGILEAAQVPFLLWGSHEDEEKLKHPFDRGWYQFNRMSYIEPRYGDAYTTEVYQKACSLQPAVFRHQSLVIPANTVVVTKADGSPIMAWRDGEVVYRKPSEEKA
jgi:hypothetical protein